jgi:signal transduction histidine kinase
MDKVQRDFNLRSIARFEITKGQWVIATLALLSILALGFSTLAQSNSTVKKSAQLSNVETPAATIIFTQRETLVYATRLAQWSNGGTTRREVQIARNLLAQRLAVIDISGRSMGTRAQASYWAALKASDEVVADSPAGILPESMHRQINAEVSPIIDEILLEARKLVVSYQRTIDKEAQTALDESARKDLYSLIFFYSSFFFAGIFLLLNVLTNFRNYRRAGIALDDEQKRLDETLRELQIAQSTVDELQKLNDAKNAFIATVNHELRTPLTSIIGYIDLMREERIKEGKTEPSQNLDILNRNAQILLNIVESMLTLIKLDSNQMPLKLDKVWFNEVVENAIFTMKPQADKSHITMRLESDDDYFVEGDAGLLTQVFINLLGNAVKFSPAESSILISIGSTKKANGAEYAKVSVSDSGIGIPAEDLEQLFTRFFRAKNAVLEHFQGTGLGLSIVAQVLQRHHGEIEVESIEGTGTTFTVFIPLFLSSDEKLIRERRGDVLKRAIVAIEGSSPLTIRSIAHEMGGALGFYGFPSAGSDLVEYSRTLSDEVPLSLEDFENSRTSFLTTLNSELEKIEGGSNG